MRALSMTQPWATILAGGQNRVETRSWATSHRGDIAIHAAKAFPRDAKDTCGEWPFDAALRRLGYARAMELPRGVIIGVRCLRDVVSAEEATRWVTKEEREFGEYARDRFAWVFESTYRLLREPVPVRGMLGLWTVPGDIAATVQERIIR